MGSMVMEPTDIISYAEIYLPGENYTSICLPFGKINSGGIFHGDSPFDYSVPLLLAQLSLASLVILFTSSFFKPIGQPSMVIQILGGLILGPSFLGKMAGFTAILYPFKSLIVLDTLAVFGYMFYFFLIGVQMDPWVIKRIDRKDITIGISTVFVAMILSMSGSFSLIKGGVHMEPEIASSLPPVGMSNSVLAFPVIAHYLTEVKMINSEVGRTALSASLVSNIFSFCILTFSITTNQSGGVAYETLQTVVSGIGLALIIFFAIRPLIVYALKECSEGETMKQGFIFMVLVGVLLTGFCSKVVGINIFIGPLLYGIAIPAGPPLGSALVEKLDLITSWLFMPLYFVKNGLVTDVFSVRPKNFVIVQFVILTACTGKFLGALVSSLYNRVPFMEAIQVGLIMNVQGVLELGMFKIMKQNQLIHEEAFAVACISMLLVTAIVTTLLRSLHNPLRRHATRKRRTVMDLKPDSEFRVVVCIHEQENVPGVIHLMEMLNPTKGSPIIMCMIHLVELIGRAHPILIPHKLHKLNSRKASSSRSIINAFKNFQQRHQGIMTIHPYTSISSYETMHDEICEMAVDRRASLIVTPFHRKTTTSRLGELAISSESGIRTVNENILETSPCTTAIIIERAAMNHHHHQQQQQTSRPSPAADAEEEECSSNTLLYRVAVFFIGGPDDREALAIGARMASNTSVKLAIVRIITNANISPEHAKETKIDNHVINEIRRHLVGNMRVTYTEHQVSDGTGTVALIRSIENLYELIIVGRNHDTRLPLMHGLADWSDGTELGTIGDMFAIEQDTDSVSTILVVQRHMSHVVPHNGGGLFAFRRSIREGPTAPLRTSAV